MEEEARINVKNRLTKARENFTKKEIAKAYGCKPANFCILLKKFDLDQYVNNSTVVRINRALDKLEDKK